MKCLICGHDSIQVFSQVILGKYRCQYFYCAACGFLHTEKPYWREEAYSNAITCADTGLVMRNIAISRQLSVLLYRLFGSAGRYVDFAGGTGLLVRLMRDIGFDYYWKDLYCINVHARGFDFKEGLAPCHAVTAFEALEHLENPLSFIADALNEAKSNTIVFTTELFEGAPPSPGDWWYYACESGQHISFYQRKTLEMMASQLGLHYYSVGCLHLMSKKGIPPLALITSRAARFSFPLIQRKMRSKTMDDHFRLLQGMS